MKRALNQRAIPAVNAAVGVVVLLVSGQARLALLAALAAATLRLLGSRWPRTAASALIVVTAIVALTFAPDRAPRTKGGRSEASQGVRQRGGPKGGAPVSGHAERIEHERSGGGAA